MSSGADRKDDTLELTNQLGRPSILRVKPRLERAWIKTAIPAEFGSKTLSPRLFSEHTRAEPHGNVARWSGASVYLWYCIAARRITAREALFDSRLCARSKAPRSRGVGSCYLGGAEMIGGREEEQAEKRRGWEGVVCGGTVQSCLPFLTSLLPRTSLMRYFFPLRVNYVKRGLSKNRIKGYMLGSCIILSSSFLVLFFVCLCIRMRERERLSIPMQLCCVFSFESRVTAVQTKGRCKLRAGLGFTPPDN